MDIPYCTMTSDYHSLTREAVVKLLEQRDAELKNKDTQLKNREAELKIKDAELERKSRRILELERMVFGRRRVNQQVQNYKTYLKNSHFGVEKFNFSLGLSFNFFCMDIILLSV